MSTREAFEKVYASVCEKRGWTCSPSEVEVPIEGGRHQRVGLDFFEHAGLEFVRFHSVIGSTEKIRTDRLAYALQVNYGLPYGSLAVTGTSLVIVDTLILREADPTEIDACVSFLAETADYYERTMFGSDEH